MKYSTQLYLLLTITVMGDSFHASARSGFAFRSEPRMSFRPRMPNQVLRTGKSPTRLPTTKSKATLR
jgi:hypothetical protein